MLRQQWKLLEILEQGDRSDKSEEGALAVKALKLIQVFAEHRDLASVFRLCQAIFNSTPPTPHVFAAVIDACIKCGQPERALTLQAQISPTHDNVIFSLFTRVCAQTGDISTTQLLATALLEDKLTFQPTHLDCAQLLESLVNAGKLDDAVALFQTLEAKGFSVRSAYSFAVLLRDVQTMCRLAKDACFTERLRPPS